jgi:hypothetical protein
MAVGEAVSFYKSQAELAKAAAASFPYILGPAK